MIHRTFDELSAALDVLRGRYESGDRSAALEAIALIGPIGMISDDPTAPGWISAAHPHRRGTNDEGLTRLYFPPLPEWLEIAMREALYSAIRYGQDSIRMAFGAPVASGSATTQEELIGTHKENVALGYRLGFQAARADTGLRYPHGESAASLAGSLLRTKPGHKAPRRVSEQTVNRWCRSAIDRGALQTYPRQIHQYARRVYQYVFATEQYPPWNDWDDLSVLDKLERKGLLDPLIQKRFF